jgi:hypothetical protein
MKNMAMYHAFLWYTYRTTHSREALRLNSSRLASLHLLSLGVRVWRYGSPTVVNNLSDAARPPLGTSFSIGNLVRRVV